MYKVGDYVVHNGHGVCIIIDEIISLEPQKNCFKLQTISNKMNILMPCEKTSCFLRPLLSIEEIKKAIHQTALESISYTKDNKERKIQFQGLITSNEISDTLSLLFQLYQLQDDKKKEKKNLGSFDSQFLQQAERKIVNEIAIAANITKEEAQKYILAQLKPQPVL